jgi:hypothetical protein
MLADLEALTPPLIVGGAFLIGVVLFLRRQMTPRRGPEDESADDDIATGTENVDPAAPAQGSSVDPHKV